MPDISADLACLRRRLPAFVLSALEETGRGEMERLEEIRLCTGFPVEIVSGGRRRRLGAALSAAQLDEALASLSGYALYGCEAQLAQGYLPLGGGHRAGVCGRMCRQQDGSWRMADVSSVCIRIGRRVDGAGSGVYRHLTDEGGNAQSVLLLGPPGCGKTTVLRDCARYLAGEKRMHVAIADEREELFIGGSGAQTDVLSGVDKAQAFSMLIRSMAPQVIVTDEIGRREDVGALLDAVRCGVGVLASAHAQSGEDIWRRPQLRALFEARAFDRYVYLGKGGCVLGVWDAEGRLWTPEKEGRHGDEGYGADGNDSCKRNRLFAL